MTVLAISLLRLGDLILQRPLIEGLRRKYPGCEIHLLVNKQFASVEFLFEGLVQRFIYFDRESLQKSCGEKEYSIFWGYQQLQSLVTEVNQTQYEAVYNFTHNRLTAHLSGLLIAKAHFGITSREGRFFGLANPWIRFFNSYFGRPEAAGFHYTELLASALEIELVEAPPKAYTAAIAGTAMPAIVIQPLTSDTKKNWSLQKYQQLAETLAAVTPYPVFVLGALFEREALEKVVDKKFLRICDLAQAAVLVKSAVAVITGDTSIKHLAALYHTPILELSLGSSQPLQVGAYTNDAVILQPRVACGPCGHSVPCSQASHRCGNELSLETVLGATLAITRIVPADWLRFAYDHPELRVFKTKILPVIGWTVECLSVSDKSKFDEVLQQKTMIVEDLNRRHLENKGVPHEQRTQRTRKVSNRSPEAS